MATEPTVSVLLVDGVGGPSIYVNDYRVAGPKPWGGGTIRREWTASEDDFTQALNQPTPDRRITVDPTDEAVVARVAQVLADGDGRFGTAADWMDSARAVLSALADGDTP